MKNYCQWNWNILCHTIAKKLAENSTGFNFTNLGQDVWKVFGYKGFYQIERPTYFPIFGRSTIYRHNG